jgi:hypothetical protein
VSSTLAQPVKGSCLETTQHFSIYPFCLSIASRVSDRGKTNLASKILDVLHEGVARELSAVVGDDSIRNPEPANQSFKELDG